MNFVCKWFLDELVSCGVGIALGGFGLVLIFGFGGFVVGFGIWVW